MEEKGLLITTSILSGLGFIYIDNLKQKYYQGNYDIIPLFHSIIVGLPSYYIYMKEPNIIMYLSETPGNIIPIIYKIIPCFTLGYGILDIYDSYRRKRIDFFVHGCIIIFGYGSLLYYDGIYLAIMGNVNEMSTIFLNIAKTIYTKILFLIVFTYIRFYLYYQIMYKYFNTTPNNIIHYYIIMLFSLIFTALNCIWYKKMLTIMFNYKKMNNINK